MGIDYALISQLAELMPKIENKKNLLMLGRQKLHINLDRFRELADAKMSEILAGTTIDSLTKDDDYAEDMWKAFGVKKVESLDYSDYEGADIVHDLNQPIPKKLHGKYDVVFDGGTLEHVFDVKTSMTNAFNLVAPGGVFIGASPGNNWFAHGFYQFSPDLVFSFWKRGCGCKVLDCKFVPEFPRDKAWTIEDPFDTKRRVVMRGKQVPQRCYLFYAVQKPKGKPKSKNAVLQGDYTHLWEGDT